MWKPAQNHPTNAAVLKPEDTIASPGGLVNTGGWAPFPEFLDEKVWGGAQEFAFLTSSQVMLRLLVQRPHSENHCTKRWEEVGLPWWRSG